MLCTQYFLGHFKMYLSKLYTYSFQSPATQKRWQEPQSHNAEYEHHWARNGKRKDYLIYQKVKWKTSIYVFVLSFFLKILFFCILTILKSRIICGRAELVRSCHAWCISQILSNVFPRVWKLYFSVSANCIFAKDDCSRVICGEGRGWRGDVRAWSLPRFGLAAMPSQHFLLGRKP